MKPEDTGLTFEDIKEKVDKYMIETYERMDFLAESAKDQYIYNEKATILRLGLCRKNTWSEPFYQEIQIKICRFGCRKYSIEKFCAHGPRKS